MVNKAVGAAAGGLAAGALIAGTGGLAASPLLVGAISGSVGGATDSIVEQGIEIIGGEQQGFDVQA